MSGLAFDPDALLGLPGSLLRLLDEGACSFSAFHREESALRSAIMS